MPHNRRYERRAGSRLIRDQTAAIAFNRPHLLHQNNGDETRLRNPPPNTGDLNFVANFSKGLPHNDLGEVERGAYGSMLRAIASGSPDEFEQIILGTPPGLQRRKLTNPQAGLAFDLEGADPQEKTLPPAPAFSSAEIAAEMAELYWMALLRDVPFEAYDNNIAKEAARSLSKPTASPSGEFSDFRGPQNNTGRVTTGQLFHGSLPGDERGPFVSQFLLQGTETPWRTRADGIIGYGAQVINQRIFSADPTPTTGQADFILSRTEWLARQRGFQPTDRIPGEVTPRFIHTLRDLGIYVRADRNYQTYLNAALIIMNGDHLAPAVPDRSPLRLPVSSTSNPNDRLDGTDPGNPYDDRNPFRATTNEGFVTFGDWHILALLAEVTTRALKAAWYQKWFVHRRLRPEEFGGRVDTHLKNLAQYPIDSELLTSLKTGLLSNYYGPPPPPTSRFTEYLLPQAFPEGSPLHPAYPSGHATVAGACVTLLKAWFDDTRRLADFLPVSYVTDPTDRSKLTSVTMPNAQTLGDELNKLASNISIARNGAGVHWRTDYYRRGDANQPDLGGIALGEEVAIELLREQSGTYNELHQFSFVNFRGAPITIP